MQGKTNNLLPMKKCRDKKQNIDEDSDPAKDLITYSFSVLNGCFTSERLKKMDVAEIFGALYPDNAELVIKMWRFLLDRSDKKVKNPAIAALLIFNVMECVWNSDSSL